MPSESNQPTPLLLEEKREAGTGELACHYSRDISEDFHSIRLPTYLTSYFGVAGGEQGSLDFAEVSAYQHHQHM